MYILNLLISLTYGFECNCKDVSTLYKSEMKVGDCYDHNKRSI